MGAARRALQTVMAELLTDSLRLPPLEQFFQLGGIPAQNAGAAVGAVFAVGGFQPLLQQPGGLVVGKALPRLDGPLARHGYEHVGQIVLTPGQSLAQKIPGFGALEHRGHGVDPQIAAAGFQSKAQ